MKNSLRTIWPPLTMTLLLGASWLALSSTHADSAEPSPSSPRILNVDVVPAKKNNAYTVRRNFVGSIEARRSSQLGFELGGRVETLFVEEGTAIEKGEKLAQLDTARLEARREEMKARLGEVQASLELRRKTLGRLQKADARNAVSDQEVDEALQELQIQEAIERRIRAQLESIAIDLDKSTLRAPFSGTIAQRYLDEGEVVSAGKPIVRLLENSRPEVRLGVSVDYLPLIERQREFTIHIRKRNYTATVKSILPDRDIQTRTATILFSLKNLDHNLLEGDLATLALAKTIEHPGFWLPLSALTESAQGLWACYVCLPHHSAMNEASHILERRELQILHIEQDRAFVEGSLQSGDFVVRDGLHRIVPHQRVNLSQGDRELYSSQKEKAP